MRNSNIHKHVAVVLFIGTTSAYMHVNCNNGALSTPNSIVLPLCLQHKAAAYKCDDVAALQRMAFICMPADHQGSYAHA